MRATIEPREKSFALMLGTREIGSSKNDSDARFHMHAINDALDAEFKAGVEEGKNSVTRGLQAVADIIQSHEHTDQ